MKNRIRKSISIAAGIALLAAAPVAAEVKKQDVGGFLVTHIAEVEASPDEIWKRLIKPKDWWNKNHSWSGSVEGFYISPQAGGCFCESIKDKDKDGNPVLTGSVEHMRVIHANPGKVLRMTGALGPLQSEAVNGTLTVAMAPAKDKDGVTAVSFNYIVGGYMRFKVADMAKAVDGVIGEQFRGMIKPFKSTAEGDVKDGVWELDIEGLTGGGDKPKKEDTKPAEEKAPAEKGR